MSVREQDEIIGRLTRETADLRRQLAFIDAELEGFADGLGRLGGYANGHVRAWGRGTPDRRTLESIPESVTKYADISKLSALIDEGKRIASELARKEQALDAVLPK